MSSRNRYYDVLDNGSEHSIIRISVHIVCMSQKVMNAYVNNDYTYRIFDETLNENPTQNHTHNIKGTTCEYFIYRLIKNNFNRMEFSYYKSN